MSKFFYSKLALSNIKKNAKIYFPYILTCIITVSMFFIICALALNKSLANSPFGGATLVTVLGMASVVTAVFCAIFLFYTNSFLVKRRKKEFGLYSILGMEKKHISKMVFLETFFIGFFSVAIGIIAGSVFSKLLYLLLFNILKVDLVVEFQISYEPILYTILLFAGIFFLILLKSLGQIHLSNPIELLKGGSVGEKEPKTKWIMTILGLLCLGGGYYIAVAFKNPVATIYLFFIAVILVIFGTYFLFTSGSISLLKLLRKNKKYYYKTKHFSSVSGMIYRMKQNAVGLANICILSTAVLVMVSSSLSLYLGINDIIETRYPNDILVTSTSVASEDDKIINSWIDEGLKAKNLSIQSKTRYTFLQFSALEQGNKFLTDTSLATMNSIDNLSTLFFLPLNEYNAIQGTNIELNDDEILIYSNRNQYNQNTLNIFDKTFKVKQKIDSFTENGRTSSNVTGTHYIIVKDVSVMEKLYEKNLEAYGEHASHLSVYYGFDIDADNEAKVNLYKHLEGTMPTNESLDKTILECRAENNSDTFSLFGSFFFVGIFLGALFIMATILIIYYKQISEGYDDKERFQIMKKVGMSHSEIKKSIRSQVLTVFFLPLITAGIHICVAFPAIKRILAMLQLTNVSLFIGCTAACFIVFAIFYAVIYAITARIYYKIVE